jgi:imidazolonepropionase-like amidohydrolase
VSSSNLRNPRRWFAALMIVGLLPGIAASALAAPAVLLKNGMIHTETARGTLKAGSVLIVAGQVSAVGTDLVAPEGATIVDLHGRVVTPALFGGISSIGVTEVTEESVTNDGVLKLGQMRPEFDVSLAFNPESISVQVSRADGIGFAVVAPGTEAGQKGAPGSSIIPGLASVVRLDGRPPRAPVALSVVLGHESSPLAGDSRAAAYMLLAQALEESRNPAAATSTDARLLTPAGRRILKSFVTEQRPVLLGLDRAADIRTAVDFAQREKLHIVISGGAEAWRVASLLKRADVAVILDPLDDLPVSFDQVGATLDNATRLHAAGVTIAFSLRDTEPHNIRKLRQAAGIAVAHGLPWDVALSAITSAPARMFRAAGEFGSIEPGKPANLVVWSGDPLEVTSLVDAAWYDGQRATLRSRQTELRDRYLPKVRAGTAR